MSMYRQSILLLILDSNNNIYIMHNPKYSMLVLQIACVVNLIRKYITILLIDFINIDMNG